MNIFEIMRVGFTTAMIVGSLILSTAVQAQQSKFPPCPTVPVSEWDNCWGAGDFVNGQTYDGEFKNGKPNGFGTSTWPDGHKYIGYFKDGKMNGQAIYDSTSGERYVGQWRDNRRNGKGTLFWPDGRKYVGEFRDDKFNGRGILYGKDGSISQMGIWNDGHLMQATNDNFPTAPPIQQMPQPLVKSPQQN